MRERKDIVSKSYGTVFQENGYPSNTSYQEGYWLYPSELWNNLFQNNIHEFYNSDLSVYEKYHEILKKLKNPNKKKTVKK